MSNAPLSSLYPQHLATLQVRAAEALRRGGFDHRRLTVNYKGLPVRLTDQGGKVVKDLLA